MKVFFKKLRNKLIADAYLNTLLTSIANQVHVVNISESRNPLFPCVTFERSIAPADAWVLNRHQFSFVIQVFSKKNYEECENIYWCEDAAVLTTYTYAQGVKAILHGQKYMAESPYVEQILELDEPDYLFDDESKTYIMRAPYKAIMLTTDQIQMR